MIKSTFDQVFAYWKICYQNASVTLPYALLYGNHDDLSHGAKKIIGVLVWKLKTQ